MCSWISRRLFICLLIHSVACARAFERAHQTMVKFILPLTFANYLCKRGCKLDLGSILRQNRCLFFIPSRSLLHHHHLATLASFCFSSFCSIFILLLPLKLPLLLLPNAIADAIDAVRFFFLRCKH